ncbi:PPR domain-containing protein/PPR_2 domain-containing protein, partial [Cephalotus follicularis]
PNVVSWTSLMAGYIDMGRPKMALWLFGGIYEGLGLPNEFTFATVINACSILAELKTGRKIHAFVEIMGFQFNIVVSSSLIDMYGKCEDVEGARRVFDLMECRNVVSWTSMIAAYAQNAKGDEALEIFREFNTKMVDCPNEFMFASVIGSCASLGRLVSGKVTHGAVIRRGHDSNDVVASALVDMYAKCGCVHFFHVMDGFGYEYSVHRLNKVVEAMCASGGNNLVKEAKFVVFKLKEWIKADGVTYKLLIKGFCDLGDMIEASKVWNLMVDDGFQPDVDAVNKMMETLFKVNRYDEGLKVFQMMRVKRMDDLGPSSYRLVIHWMCKRGKIEQAYVVFEEMCKRGIRPDNLTLAALIYGLLSRGRIREGYRVFEGIETPDISVYHGFIMGLLKLRKAGEATQVFREMIKRGCEPIMHTYIMLLQG